MVRKFVQTGFYILVNILLHTFIESANSFLTSEKREQGETKQSEFEVKHFA